MLWLIVLLVIVALIVIALIALYNRFVRYRNRVDNAWAQIEVQLKRRWDLIPNLVETVKGYAAHERGRSRPSRRRGRMPSARRALRRLPRPRASSVRPSAGSSPSPRRTRSSRRTRTSASSRTSSPGRRTGSPCRGRSTTTPSSRTTTRSDLPRRRPRGTVRVREA
jgi:hypothetical protein